MRNFLRKIYFKLFKPIYYLDFKLGSTPNYIIIGNPKTGTSVISSLIANRGGLTRTIDIPEMWYKQIDLYRDEIRLEDFVKRNPHRFNKSLVKEPDLTFLYDKIVSMFPEAKIILIIRHPIDNIRSILDRVNISPNSLPIKVDNINNRNIIEPWKWFLTGEVLKNNPANKVPYTLAHNWVYTVNLYLNNQDSIYLIRYEDFIEDKIKFIDKYCEDLNIEKNNDISNLIDKQYQPKGKNKNKKVEELFSMEVIEKIENICSIEMRKLGYEFYSKE